MLLPKSDDFLRQQFGLVLLEAMPRIGHDQQLELPFLQSSLELGVDVAVVLGQDQQLGYLGSQELGGHVHEPVVPVVDHLVQVCPPDVARGGFGCWGGGQHGRVGDAGRVGVTDVTGEDTRIKTWKGGGSLFATLSENKHCALRHCKK